MDVFSDVLRVVRLSGAVFFTAECSAPWAIESPSPELLASVPVPDAPCLSYFHVVMDGECLVECGQAPVRLGAGDAIVLPHGEPHLMRSRDAAHVAGLDRFHRDCTDGGLLRLRMGGCGLRTRLICGYLSCEQRFGPLFGVLPTMLVVRRVAPNPVVEAIDRHGRHPTAIPHRWGEWTAATLSLMIAEARDGRPGHAIVLRALAELLFVGAIRDFVSSAPARRAGWLTAVHDPRVGRVLRLMHATPEREWTVTRLARAAAISRSGLAERFRQLTGSSPMRYLTGWRMQLAQQLLRGDALSVEAVAARVGYRSEPAFTRAFKRETGLPPATWRRVRS